MSVMSDLDQDLQTIRRVMEDDMGEGLSPEEQLERRCDGIIRELDEVLAMAVDPNKVDLIEGEYQSISQMLVRVEIVASILNQRAEKARRIRLVADNG